jgi:hypothetical protein
MGCLCKEIDIKEFGNNQKTVESPGDRGKSMVELPLGKLFRMGKVTLQELRKRIYRSLLCGWPSRCFSG